MYHREHNDYANATYKEIALDLGIGVSFITKFRQHIPKEYDIRHVLSDLAYMIYALTDYEGMKQAHKYLQSLGLTERRHEAYFNRLFGFKMDHEAVLLYDVLVKPQQAMI